MTTTQTTPPSPTLRTAILESAIAVFAAQGFTGTSFQDVANHAGTQKSHVQYHFGSKDELWRSAFEYAMRGFLEAFEREMEEREPTFENIATARFRAFVERPEVARIHCWMALGNGPVPDSITERHRRLLATIEEHPPTTRDLEVDNRDFYALVYGAVHGYFIFRPLFDPDGTADSTKDPEQFLQSMRKMLF